MTTLSAEPRERISSGADRRLEALESQIRGLATQLSNVADEVRSLRPRDGVLPASLGTRCGQLIAGIVCMVMIANLQYGWTLFVNPIDQKYHWGRAAIQ